MEENMDFDSLLKDGALEYNIELSENQIQQFRRYKELLIEWNEKMNLTAIEDEYDIVIKHFIDSISCFSTKLIEKGLKLIDIGTGAGFPGIPIKIAAPEMEVVLLDSLNKRVNFLNAVINELNLKGITAIHGRAEDIAHKKEHREKYDIAVARAVANLSVLSEYCIPFVKTGGYFISMKGPNVNDELTQAQNAFKILGGEFKEKLDIKLPKADITHSIIVIKKLLQCPTKYPRKAGKPSKEPL